MFSFRASTIPAPAIDLIFDGRTGGSITGNDGGCGCRAWTTV
jgi:hypothetical protein